MPTRLRATILSLIMTVSMTGMGQLRAQTVPSSHEAQVAQAIAGRSEIRVQTNAMALGHVVVSSPSVQGGVLFGTIQTGTFQGQAVFETRQFPIEAIDEIKVRSGRQVLLGTLIGATAGAAFVGAILENCNQNPDQCDASQNSAGTYVLAFGVWTLLGTATGALIPRWVTVYSRGTPVVVEPYSSRGPGRRALVGLSVRLAN